jgi:hypothetical protein
MALSRLRGLGLKPRHAQTSHDGYSRRGGDGADNPGPVHESPAYLRVLAARNPATAVAGGVGLAGPQDPAADWVEQREQRWERQRRDSQ